MTGRIWDSFLTETDKNLFATLGYDARAGFGERPAVLVIDANRAFCGDKPLPVHEAIKISRTSCGQHAWDAIAKIEELVKLAREKQVPVIYTTNSFRDDKWDIGSWGFKRKSATKSSEHGTATAVDLVNGNEIVAPLTPAARDIVVHKQKPSGFFGTNLVAYLQLLRCDSVIVTGGTTSGCVRATVLDAFSLNYRIAVVEDACFDRFEASHAISLCDMQSRYADVMPTSEALNFLSRIKAGIFALPNGL